MTKRKTAESQSADASQFVNCVQLVGRVSAETTLRTLPSGDEIATWRVAVPRPQQAGEPRRVDTFNCVSFESGIRREATVWSAGDVVDVTGAMRLRFWRGPDGLRSRYELDVQTARRVPTSPGSLTSAVQRSSA